MLPSRHHGDTLLMNERPADLLHRLTNGVYVVGVAHEQRVNAFTAAWITQVSFDPLLLALSIQPGCASYPLLRQSGRFAVSVLGQGQVEAARHFGTVSGRDVDKLAGSRWRRGSLGAPVIEDALAFFECRVDSVTAAGDHMLVLGKVEAGGVLDEQAIPLRYDETGNIDGSEALFPPRL
jgi:flavin reductase (DIM6/NTAB) family NADH-FMN oxidoreductase RutF